MRDNVLPIIGVCFSYVTQVQVRQVEVGHINISESPQSSAFKDVLIFHEILYFIYNQ